MQRRRVVSAVSERQSVCVASCLGMAALINENTLFFLHLKRSLRQQDPLHSWLCYEQLHLTWVLLQYVMEIVIERCRETHCILVPLLLHCSHGTFNVVIKQTLKKNNKPITSPILAAPFRRVTLVSVSLLVMPKSIWGWLCNSKRGGGARTSKGYRHPWPTS